MSTPATTIDLLDPEGSGPIDRVVRGLRDLSLATPVGALLGSEEDLLAELGVSRPTLRQAARLLEYQGLVTVRRGAGGGYFASRPDIRSVTEAAAIYLHTQGTPLAEIVAAAHSFSVEVAKRAALSRDEERRTAVARVSAEVASEPADAIDGARFVAQDFRLSEAIYRLVGNTPLELMIRVFNIFALGIAGGNILEGHPERRIKWRAQRLKLVEAILARDAAGAQAAMLRLNGYSTTWVALSQAERDVAR